MMQLRIAIGLALLAFETHAEMNPESFMNLCGAVQMIHATASAGRLFIGSGVAMPWPSTRARFMCCAGEPGSEHDSASTQRVDPQRLGNGLRGWLQRRLSGPRVRRTDRCVASLQRQLRHSGHHTLRPRRFWRGPVRCIKQAAQQRGRIGLKIPRD